MKSVAEIIIKNFRKDKYYVFNDLIASQWLTTSKIREIQEKKLLKLLEHCKKNVSYYSEVLSFSNIKNLPEIVDLPFLTKKIINDRRDDLKARNMQDKYFLLNSTGGSTGESMKFYSDNYNKTSFGLTMRNNMWTGWNLGERQAMLWGSHYDISLANKIINRIKNKLIHKILYLSSYDMKEDDMMSYCKMINNYKPKLITAYPSGINVFADFLAKKNLKIYKPKGIICSGETLYKYQRDKIESIFKCKIYNRYGCREVGNIAHQCEKNEGLHINAEHLILEVIDGAGNPCKAGENGNIVVTDLDNLVFPFIRYQIGDIGSLSDKKCSCGRGLPLLKKIEGRAFDIIIGTNGNRITGNFWTILLRTNVKGIKQFQVVQEKKDVLVLKVIADETFISEEKDKLIQEIRSKCGDDMHIIIENVRKIPLTKSGKNRFVVSNIAPTT